MAEAFIKICRKMLDWEWYDDTNTKVLFLHCLLKANWKSGSWHGIDYEPGQFITSLQTLANETHLSIRQVRVALDHLKMTGEVTIIRHSKCSVVTITNWVEYQTNDKQNGTKKTVKRQTNDKVVTIDKEYKEGEEVKEVKNTYGEYRHVKLTDRERDRLFNDYGEVETLEAIKYLDEYIQRKGYKAKDHNLTLRKWVFKAVEEEKGKRSNQQQDFISAWRNA